MSYMPYTCHTHHTYQYINIHAYKHHTIPDHTPYIPYIPYTFRTYLTYHTYHTIPNNTIQYQTIPYNNIH
jgi:hypothetical protein